MTKNPAAGGVRVRALDEHELDAADQTIRLAFGTFLRLPDPMAFMGDAGYARSRWTTDPEAAYALELEGRLAGSNFAVNWGSFGFFGPLSIRPDLWDRGFGSRLMEPVIACFERWGSTHTGLFTFAQSQKHVGLYRKFGFWPRFLTAIMSRPVPADAAPARGWSRYSKLASAERGDALAACRELTDTVHPGLDLSLEIASVERQGLGDTLLLWDEGRLAGLAVCHSGPGSEGGSGTCYLKFAAVRPGRAQDFERLLAACESLALALDARRISAGVNTARHEAYRAMLARGYRTDVQGIAMQRDNAEGYNRPGVFVIDDWR